ncbi:hypothetical protein X759_04260 [Mesorhizobium sp. LSHC420B00]|nr:hypothetical protein X759_04260 [Mesorhizobium sp. LSHC420B00]
MVRGEPIFGIMRKAQSATATIKKAALPAAFCK